MQTIKNNLISNARIFLQMTRRDVRVLSREFAGDLINAVTWPASLAITFGYVLPAIGMDPKYGSFLVVGAIASTFFYLALGFGNELVSDFCSLRCIDYYFTLPASSYRAVLIQRVLSFTAHSVFITLPLLPIGKLILGDRMDLSQVSIIKLVLMMTACGVFFGFFGLWLASWIATPRAFNSVWRRVYTPLQLLGCYWFSFFMGYKVFGFAALIALTNPLTYMCEGVRAAVLGQSEHMNFWLCLVVLIAYTSVFGWYAMRKLRRRLDLL